MTDALLAWFMQFSWACRLPLIRRAFLRDSGPCGCGRPECPYREVGMCG